MKQPRPTPKKLAIGGREVRVGDDVTVDDVTCRITSISATPYGIQLTTKAHAHFAARTTYKRKKKKWER